ncbi:glycoside hydrolase family 9 protein [Maribacter sp. ANRC-HE7]|uniref:Endoglucanase n=1 Tax=Maribacter aquimaris TaxID=2737171 RepID=A0ABR7V1U7_9FLAO|nr:glycoside hydrolase family 9 protein [Maribacter aquimaris]MBD0778797.1 glycoside hydrolase family 9 protein [Maribacter aquimaris]
MRYYNYRFVWMPLLLIVTLLGCKEKLPNNTGNYTDQIRLNQIGYYPKAIKRAVIVDAGNLDKFSLVDTKADKVVYSGNLTDTQNWELAGEKVQIAEFSDVTAEGEYVLYVEDLGYSYPFKIKENVLQDVFLGSIKGMYYQRVGMPLEKKYAGKWHRPMAHPDDSVPYHPSSGKSKGYISSTKGWYDAGDYNKYVVNGSFPLGQFYMLQEQYPGIIADKALNIPESGNGKSDLLDELKYEMDWLLTMQDDDGGLFHKLTTKSFEGMVMPNKATSQRYIVGKGTAATLDFAACAAQAYRIFKEVDPSYADQCLVAAKKAYSWAVENPEIEFLNPEDISTGQYGDKDFEDEWFWANAELYISTNEPLYLDTLNEGSLDFKFAKGDNWRKFMRFTGMFSLLKNKDVIPEALFETLKNGIIASADELTAKAGELDYFQPIDDFQWGSNSDVLNVAIIMAQAYRLNPKSEYLSGVQQCVDYIFGNNATGYSFVTGFGDKYPMHIHHRQSAADGVEEPVPGLLSGGPNFGKQDVINGVVYPENAAPMKSWADQEPSYASNEICLNWNAPLTYILGFLEQESK